MNTANEMQELLITLPTVKSEVIGFFPAKNSTDIKGWWEDLDGEEGGTLWVDAWDGTVIDFDGAYDLPAHIRHALAGINILVNF